MRGKNKITGKKLSLFIKILSCHKDGILIFYIK